MKLQPPDQREVLGSGPAESQLPHSKVGLEPSFLTSLNEQVVSHDTQEAGKQQELTLLLPESLELLHQILLLLHPDLPLLLQLLSLLKNLNTQQSGSTHLVT